MDPYQWRWISAGKKLEVCFDFGVVCQVDHLSKKPKDGERCLREIQSILIENDISPFEVGQNKDVPR
jgi:hypothetical protein